MNKKSFSITYNGPFKDAGGYAKMNREIVKALLKNNIDVSINAMNSNRNCKELSLKDLYKETGNYTKPLKEFYIDGCLPQMPSRNKKYDKSIAFTMMETETIHKDFINKCNFYDAIFVPCEWNLKTFKKFGIKRPIYKVPLGVDINLYTPNGDSYNFISEKENKFIFFSLFGWSKRKGCDILLRSFIRKFGNNPNVILVVASRMWGSEEASRNRMILEEMNSYAKQEGYKKLPSNIIHIGTGFEEEEMPSLFRGSDCFILPTRGDSFGLPLIEAAACEIPIITTNHGGQLEYLDSKTSTFIDIEGFEDCKNLGLDKISSYYAKDIKIAKLHNKSIENLGEKMTYIINNYNEVKQKSKVLREKIKNNFTWDHSAKKVIQILSGDDNA